MARVRKPQPTLEALFFSTPEQKVLRFLLSEPTTSFTPRVISSRLKGVRGLGGADGIQKVLEELRTLGLVDFVDNERAVRVHDDNPAVHMMKVFASVCDLEGLKAQLEPFSSRGILFGSRSNGRARSDSDYDLFVVSDNPEEVRKTTARHPLAKKIELVVWTQDQYDDIETSDPGLERKLSRGVVLWGPT